MRKLFLHVGVHRTGTTSTQRFMRENFDTLLRKGLLYPFGVKRHDRLILRILDGSLKVEDLALDLEKRAGSHPHPVHSVVLSDEDISLIRDFNLFAPLKERFEVKVVVSMRRQDLWLESWYLQNIKWQWNPALAHLSFDEFFERRAEFFWIDYAERFAHFETVFGPGSVVAGVFERGDMPEGPIQSFLHMLGIQDLTGFGPFVHRNSSLTPLMSEFMRNLPMDEMPIPERTLVEAACIEVDKTLPTNGSKLLMNFDQRAQVVAEYADSNRHVAKTWFDREVLFRDPLPPRDAPLADHTIPAGSGELIGGFVAPILRKLTLLMAKAREEHQAALQAAEAKARAAAPNKRPAPAK